MRPDDIYRLLRQQPFQPFRLHLSNGRSYEVRHPELVAVGRTTMFVGRPAPDLAIPAYDDFDIITLLHINNVELLASGAAPGANGPGQ